MMLGLYSIRDIHTGYLSITTDINDNSALRNFEHALEQQNTLYYTHPSDYDLYRVGTYDTETGEIIAEMILLTTGRSFKRKQKPKTS